MKMKNNDVIVTLVIGEKYKKIYDNIFHESHKRFSDHIQTDFVIIDRVIELSKRHKHPAWQKMLIFHCPKITDRQRILFVDADIYITKHAKNPFLIAQNTPWAMANNNPYKVDYLTKNDLKLYNHCPVENRPKILLNSGVFIVDKSCRDILNKVFYNYDEQICYENGPISYHLLNDSPGTILPSEFNVIVVAYRMAYGHGLSVILKMYHESSFLHFAGGSMKTMPTLPIIKYIDTTKSSFFKRIIYFLGRKDFDFITAPLLDLIGKFLVIYSYHIKRRFIKK